MINLYKTMRLQTAKPTREARIYGIERDYTQPDPTWTRTDAAVGKTVAISVGSKAGHSDFDTCYPWSAMKRVTLPTGDVMVKIPSFYYQRTRDGNIERIRIADRPTEGFEKHPGSGCYVGAYQSNKAEDSSLPLSKSGVFRKAFTSASAFNVAQKGNGWSEYDYKTQSAIIFLFLVEFATNAVMTAILRNPSIPGLRVTTGYSDSVPNLTGVVASTKGINGSVYRGVEDFLGGYSENVNGLSLYVPGYGNSEWRVDGESFSSGWQTGSEFVKDVSFLDKKPWIMLPTNGGGSNNQYYDSKPYFGGKRGTLIQMSTGYYEGLWGYDTGANTRRLVYRG